MGKRDRQQAGNQRARPGDPVSDGSLGPLTHAVADTSKGPPPIVLEWEDRLTRPGDFVLVWAGALRKREAPAKSAWWWLHCTITDDLHEPAVKNETDEPSPLRDPGTPAKVERMLSPLAHESRGRILQALYEKPLGSSGLTEATGLRGGNLHHHLKELLYSDYVRQQEGAYALTGLGRQLFLTLASLASRIVQDRGDDLVAADTWSSQGA